MFIQRIILTLATGVAISVSAAPAKTNPASSPKLLPGLGEVHHPVATKNSQAQQFFDQGFKLVFGFNHDEARKSFQRAAELDPNASEYEGAYIDAVAVRYSHDPRADLHQLDVTYNDAMSKLAARYPDDL